MNNLLPTDYQAFIHTSRYARWIEEEGRRESWTETVSRYMDNVVRPRIHEHVASEIEEAILNLDVMPSMRSLMTAGKALARDNTSGYNCSYTPIDHVRCFDEVLFILLCGTGVGFSVEQKYVNSLPLVPRLTAGVCLIEVEDSKEGWASAYRELISELYAGRIPSWDTSKVRPAGARLETFGGRASGAQPLVELFEHTIEIFKKKQRKKLSPLDVHSIMCMIGSIVIVGGVRRSAMISLSDLSDDEMRTAKSGEWYIDNPHHALANNSVAFESKPSGVDFMKEWASLAASGSGERGIFNRQAARDKAKREGIRDHMWEFGTNPCSEIVLLGQQLEEYTDAEGETKTRGIVGTGGQFCNLTEAVIRATDTEGDIANKLRLAAILGTIQATLTHFPYLRDCWKKNTEREALLGVSMTGIMDCTLTNGKEAGLEERLTKWRQVAVDINEYYAKELGINKAAAVTAVKPSGTVSSLVDSSSGIHARHSDYYIRTVRGDNKDPLTQFLTAQGIPSEPCVMKPEQTTIFSFPMKAPVGSVTRHDMTAIEQLDMWLMYQRHYTCHKPSVTVSVGDDEWAEVGAYVYKHFDEMSGVSFLPRFEHTYEQAPYQDIDEEQYEAALFAMPDAIDWSKLSEFEAEDTTKGSQTLACTGGVCDLVDI
jgi:ribonucleoside-triphosphate reductase (thioredoxin)